MTSVIILLCMLLSLLSTVYGVRCVDCLNQNGFTCDSEENIVECGDAGCVTLSESCTVDNRFVPTIKKGCAVGINEDQVLAVNDKDQIADYVAVDHCTDDLCNQGTGFTNVGKENFGEPNGKYCESCFRSNSTDGCSSRDRVECRGNQISCVSYIGTVVRGDGTVGNYCVKGCISDLMCKLKFRSLPGTEELVEKFFKCDVPCTEPLDCSGCE